MLSTILGQEFAYNDVMIYYSRTSALIKALAASAFRGESESILAKLREAQVIILDEFGYVSYDLKGVQILFDFVSEVNEKKSFITATFFALPAVIAGLIATSRRRITHKGELQR